MANTIRYRRRVSRISLVVRLSVLILLIHLAVLPAAFALGRLDTREEPRTITVQVQAGDTLWSLATDHGSPRRDVRRLVYEIRRINGVDALIHPGDFLRIPVD